MGAVLAKNFGQSGGGGGSGAEELVEEAAGGGGGGSGLGVGPGGGGGGVAQQSGGQLRGEISTTFFIDPLEAPNAQRAALPTAIAEASPPAPTLGPHLAVLPPSGSGAGAEIAAPRLRRPRGKRGHGGKGAAAQAAADAAEPTGGVHAACSGEVNAESS